jgi:NitT/TauT family transport system substrate-binding protein
MKDEERVIAFLRAHELASDLIRDEPRKAAGIVARVTGIVDEPYVLDCYRVSPRYCAALSRDFIASTMRFAPVLQELGYTTRTLAEEEVFDPRLVDAIHPEPAHYDMPLSENLLPMKEQQ